MITKINKRWANIPGVIYPKEVIQTRPRLSPENGEPYDAIPSWGITAAQAAIIIGCSVSSARAAMKKKCVTSRLVAQEGRRSRFYWEKEQVEMIASERSRVSVSEVSDGLLGVIETAKALNVSRSSIHRAIKLGKLKPIFLRVQSSKGPRRCCYFTISDINNLASSKGDSHEL